MIGTFVGPTSIGCLLFSSRGRLVSSSELLSGRYFDQTMLDLPRQISNNFCKFCETFVVPRVDVTLTFVSKEDSFF